MRAVGPDGLAHAWPFAQILHTVKTLEATERDINCFQVGTGMASGLFVASVGLSA